MISTIIRKEILLTLKDKGAFFWLFALPVLFIVIFSSIFSGAGSMTYKIPYYDADGSTASGQFVEQLGEIKGFALEAYEGGSLEDGIKEIRDGSRSYLLVVPAGYGQLAAAGQTAEIELYRDTVADEAVAPVMALLESVSAGYQDYKLRSILAGMGQNEEAINSIMEPAISIKEVKENATKANAVTQIVPGYTVMFVFFIMINMIQNLLKDRRSGMLSRLQGTPMKPIHYLVGMWVPNVLVVLVQSTVLLTFGQLVYGLQLGHPLAIAVIVLALALCATGIGLMLALLVSSENMGIAMVQIIAMGGAIVGGLWFPYDFLPKAVQTIGLFTPQYWAQKGMQDVMIRGADIGGIGWTLLILFAFGLAGLGVALLRFKKFALKTT
ncbi:ABC transporter permease [Paenibacillus paeoniae]|uniref:ABC transporter permease n=1 Tax=Paenibacillus paeoniae TaxID=2292705 RepID=A0A371P7A2_9BACL|nr:ABC transporter permease [Paenibacillus paeoniae]REK71823.1 ABC transporter permease [Paenibacillus paeoniae]